MCQMTGFQDREAIQMDSVTRIEQRAKEALSDSKGCHSWDHTVRVLRLAQHIVEVEGGNSDVVTLAAILHDIGRPAQDATKGAVCHAEEGARITREMLEEEGYDEGIIRQVVHCVLAHRHRGQNRPESAEAKIIYDADKLDSIGAIGIGRIFLFAGEHGGKLHDKHVDIENTREYTEDDTAYREFLVKLRYVKDKVYTAEGKRLAQERHDFMEEFFERLNKEVDGEL